MSPFLQLGAKTGDIAAATCPACPVARGQDSPRRSWVQPWHLTFVMSLVARPRPQESFTPRRRTTPLPAAGRGSKNIFLARHLAPPFSEHVVPRWMAGGRAPGGGSFGGSGRAPRGRGRYQGECRASARGVAGGRLGAGFSSAGQRARACVCLRGGAGARRRGGRSHFGTLGGAGMEEGLWRRLRNMPS